MEVQCYQATEITFSYTPTNNKNVLKNPGLPLNLNDSAPA